jgi:uncharacterized protein YutE (UPF0331/DUF86 family)
MVERDVIVAKLATIDRCIERVHDVRGPRSGTLLPIDAEDIIVLNLQRATQAAIDLGAHIVASESYGLPSDLGDTFTLLEQQGVIDAQLANQLRKMVGFRNIAVHQYETLDPKIIDAIVTRHLDDLRRFGSAVLARFAAAP